MKILFLSAANSIHTVKWINALASRGHEVYLVYNKGHEPKMDQINKNIHQHQLKYKGGVGYYLNAKELRKLKKEISPDIINVHYASGYGTLARKSKLCPILLSVWGSDVYDFPNKSFVNKSILKKNVLHAKKIASTSNCMANELRDVLKMPKLQIGITPFGVDLEKFKGCTEEKEKKNHKILIGTIKTLKPLYGIAELIKAVKILSENLVKDGYEEICKQLQVEIYGDGPQKEELEKLIQELSLENVIYLKGQIPNKDVPQVLSQFDVFCATSFKESFGVAVVEAMAMSLPVVVTDTDGFKEVVADGENGYIVPIGNEKAIALKLQELIIDRKKRESMGKAGRKRVEELYDWEKNVDTMEKLYEEVRVKKE